MDVPRPEYPRPQFVRPEWQNLNGEWEFAFDDRDVGLAEEWFDGRALPERIVVPFPYQCARSGINDRSIHEVVWYARRFEVPDEWRGRDLLLHFGLPIPDQIADQRRSQAAGNFRQDGIGGRGDMRAILCRHGQRIVAAGIVVTRGCQCKKKILDRHVIPLC